MSLQGKILLLLLCFSALALTSLHAQTQPKAWQEAKSISGNFKPAGTLQDIEVFSAPNVIMIKVNKAADVRIFSILGKLISSQSLEPGIFEYHIDSHGIYVVKTELSSCKIAV